MHHTHKTSRLRTALQMVEFIAKAQHPGDRGMCAGEPRPGNILHEALPAVQDCTECHVSAEAGVLGTCRPGRPLGQVAMKIKLLGRSKTGESRALPEWHMRADFPSP